MLHVAALVVAVFLLWGPAAPIAWLDARLSRTTAWQLPLGAVLTAAGLGFAAWARVHLGPDWSGIVTIKRDHALVVSGPYAVVRHPIYSGLLLAVVGTALARGAWRDVLAVLLTYAAFAWKLRLEERWMGEHFGERYEHYRRRVPALVPWIGLRERRERAPRRP